ncbi:hypothetical protein JHD50_00200 [Sulfurimonas sp. MAG313]|nr:hypothetical protein [Sulfurimonas sp. MAG313]MDF1879733.1 hypothetical protein [Sulfurimonas sp. MAG313]
MEDISEHVLFSSNEFDQYHSKVINLEDTSQSNDKSINSLTRSKDKLLNNKKENLSILQDLEKESKSLVLEHEKNQARYRYVQKTTEKLRSENTYMQEKVITLQKDRLQKDERIKALEQELFKSKTKEPKNIVHLFIKLENLKTELILAKQELKFLPKVQSENVQLKARYQELVEDRLSHSSQEKTMHLHYLKMKKERGHVYEKLKNLEAKYTRLNTLYDKALHDKELLKKKSENLILQKYNKMYESKHIFDIDMDTLKGQRDYVDIDSLIEGIDEKDSHTLKALT